jgi:uncharacterized membrane protein HdeD (DUF308 family)
MASEIITMTQSESARFKFAWISLTIIGVAIFVFGLIVTVWPGASDTLSLRSIGVASIGMGLFGVMITLIPYRRRERWAWLTLWYYPLFWLAHFLGGLPPGQDHIHQIVFIILALISLLLSKSEFFPRTARRQV